MTTIYYDDSGCGQGKTHRALDTIIEQGGRHIYAADRIEAIEERARSLRDKLPKDSPLLIEEIYSNHDYSAIGQSVSSLIEEVPSDYASHKHVVILITHEALKLANFEGFAGQGWSVWIDEVPSILDNEKHQFHLTWNTLAQLYHLAPLKGSTKWSEVLKRDSAVDVAALALDDQAQVLRPLERRVSDPRRNVFTNVREWEELSIKRRQMTWFSIWSPDELDVFDAVFMLGSGLMNSVTVRLWKKHWPEVEWEPMQSPRRAFMHRRVIITCFAEAHVASRKLFDAEEGKKNLTKIARYISERVPTNDLIWTCNKPEIALLKPVMTGEWLTPKKAGSNLYSNRHHVAALYSCKPDDSMRLVLEALGLKSEHYVGTNEYETILQFACRGSIREPSDTSDFHIYVYDRKQAEFLLAYFRDRASAYVLWPQIEVVNLGFANDVRNSKRGRKVKVLTLEEQAAKVEERREQNRLAKQRSRDKAKIASKAA